MTDIKASYNEDRLCLGERLPLDTPLSVILDISERCNFKCSYCFRSKEKDESWGYAAKNGLMSMETFCQSLQQLASFPQKIQSVSLSGHGEPLCNPDIVGMVRCLRTSGVTSRIEMHTNASLLTAEMAKEIARAGFSRIIVSLQGMDASTYQRVCGVRLDWDAFYENLRILHREKDDALRLHIKISEAAFHQGREGLEKEAFYALFDKIADTVSVEEVTPLWKNMRIETEKFVNKYGQETGEIICCPILFYKMWVAPDGEIYPCTGLPAPVSLGNIRDITLYDAWNSPQRRAFLMSHLRAKRGGHPACEDCFVPVNTVTMEKDRIDPYRSEILRRLEDV